MAGYGGNPDCREAHVLYVVEFIDDALPIPTTICSCTNVTGSSSLPSTYSKTICYNLLSVTLEWLPLNLINTLFSP